MSTKKIIVSSSDSADARVLGDLLRVYFPGIVPQYVALGSTEEQQKVGTAEAIWLEVQERVEPNGFEARLVVREQVYFGHSQDSGQFLGEMEHHLRRRLLRLSVHQALSAYLTDVGKSVSPWGILTGVRPTKIVHRLHGHGLTAPEIHRTLEQEYGLQATKAQLVTKVAARQVPYLASLDSKRKISIYVAIPFCPSRCHYCSFPTFEMGRWGHLLEGYLAALTKEIKTVASTLSARGLGVQTVYVGGGTPTVLTAGQLAQLLELLYSQFLLSPDQEVTVEAGRPDTLDGQKLQVLKDYGVNRISINPQTLHDQTLAAIGRNHRASDIINIYTLAREIGFPVINMDLILGLPGENSELLASTLEQILRLKPENITLHALALKRAAYFKQEGVNLPSPVEGAKMTALAQQTLEDAGYQAYYLYRQKEIMGYGENVGYCLPGTASLYNILMMEEKQTILGLGVGAGSKIVQPEDWSVDNFYNPKDISVYQERLTQIIAQKVDKLQCFR